MADKPVIPEEIVLEHLLDLPGEDVNGFSYSPFTSLIDEMGDIIPTIGEDTSSTAGPGGIPIPGLLTIVKQVIREAPDGSQVVDVTFEVEDIKGVTEYDLRVTKA